MIKTTKLTQHGPLLIGGLALIAAGVAPAAGTGTRAKEDWPLPVHDDVRYGQVFLDRFEYQNGDNGEDEAVWDGQAWYGNGTDRVWVSSEGEYTVNGGEGGEIENFDVQYSHRFAPFWDVQAGVGYQTTFGPGPDRDRGFAVVGLQGLAPYWFEVDTDLRLSEDGDASLGLEAEYDWQLTQRWVLQARGETSLAFSEVEAFGVGEGLTGITTGLRLRYEIAREFAPYVGVSYRELLGDTADLAEAEGEDSDRLSAVVGIRWWF